MRQSYFIAGILFLYIGAAAFAAALEGHSGRVNMLKQVQAKMVKIYGAGGLRGLEAYQSGFLISAEGHILTAYSHVLDTDYITVVLADGRKLEAKLLGADPRMEVAVLKINAAELPYFDLSQAAQTKAGATYMRSVIFSTWRKATNRQACNKALSR